MQRRVTSEVFPFGIEHGERRRRDSRGRELPLNFRPERKFRAGPVDAPGGFIFRINRGEPDDFAAGAPGELQRHGIQAAHGMIQRDGPVSGNARHGFRDDFGAFGGWKIMRLQDKAFQPARQKFLCQVQVVYAPLDHVRCDMHLQIIGALEAFPCRVGNRRGFRSGRAFTGAWRCCRHIVFSFPDLEKAAARKYTPSAGDCTSGAGFSGVGFSLRGLGLAKSRSTS